LSAFLSGAGVVIAAASAALEVTEAGSVPFSRSA
jgi:hypothetical protein